MKKRLFISSILMTLVLLVAITTATFAWYEASKGSVVKTGIDNTVLTAQQDSYTMDGLTISAEFANVDEGTDYVAATTGANAQPAHFANVALTDANGDTFVKVQGQNKLVNANSSNSKWYGTAKVVVTIKVGSTAVTMNTTNEVYAAYEGSYVVTVLADAQGHTRVRATAPGERGAENSAVASAVTFTITIAPDGKITTNLTNNALEIQFWYFESPANPNATTADATTDHNTKGIKVTIE